MTLLLLRSITRVVTRNVNAKTIYKKWQSQKNSAILLLTKPVKRKNKNARNQCEPRSNRS